MSTTSGLFVDQAIAGTYAVSGNGRGTVTHLTVTTAGIGGSLFGLLLLLWLLLACFISRRKLSRFALAMFLLAVLIVPATAIRPVPRPNPTVVFYVISPTKAVMMHLPSSDITPVITIIEQ